MNKDLAKKISQIIKRDIKKSNQFSLEEDREYFADSYEENGRTSYGAFFIKDKSDVSYWFSLQNAGRDSDIYDLSVRRDDGKTPLTILAIIVKETLQDQLEWQYIPRKRKEREKNLERKALFEQLFGSANAIIPLPINGTTLDDFLAKIFFLAKCVECAGNLDESSLISNDTRKLDLNDEDEQAELEKFYKDKGEGKDGRNFLLSELKKNLEEDNSGEKVSRTITQYERDNKIIAIIKALRGFECQIQSCRISIIKKDGTRYVEAAHITPKRENGRETPNNIILLCPNHHKEFDLGMLQIESRDENQITFVLNGEKYKLKLSLE